MKRPKVPSASASHTEATRARAGCAAMVDQGAPLTTPRIASSPFVIGRQREIHPSQVG